MSEINSLLLYIFVFSISTFLFSKYRSRNWLWRRFCIMAAIVIPSVFAGMRYRVGTDWDNYYFSMTIIRNTPFWELLSNTSIANAEYGYKVLVKLLSYVGGNGFIFGMFAFLTLLFMADALIKEYKEKNTTLAYFMFLFIYFGNSFNLMRQTLAAAIVFWGMKYLFSDKLANFIVVCLVAATIHMTALLAIPISILWNRKEKKAAKYSYFIPFAIIVGILVIFWRNILIRLLGMRFSFIQKYSIYLENNIARNRDFYVKLLVFIVLFFVFNLSIERDEKDKLYLEMGIVNLLIGTTGFYITFIKRLGIYYEIPVIIMISSVNKIFERNSRKFVNIAIGILIICYFILVYFIIGDSKIIPYQVWPE